MGNTITKIEDFPRRLSVSPNPEVLAFSRSRGNVLREKQQSEGVPKDSEPDISGTDQTYIGHSLEDLFDENITAKACRIATRLLGNDGSPRGFPEIVPQSGADVGLYDAREPDFWTCGFFPGILQALLERSIKYPQSMTIKSHGENLSNNDIRLHLQALSQAWIEPLHDMANRTDTHDIGFIIMPALQRHWELTNSERSLQSIIQASQSLASRFIPEAGVIRSWDILIKKEITVTDMSDNVLVIIDSLCNLNLLFYAAAHGGDRSLAKMAETHALTLIRTHLRPEQPEAFPSQEYRGQLYSSCHLGNISPKSGELKWRWTAQGFANESTWARGQAWAILGYAQTYQWTKNEIFLDVACGVAEYFLFRLETAPQCVEVPTRNDSSTLADISPKRVIGRFVPLWDFDAPVDPVNPLRDTSAGVIAANGMLVISQALRGLGKHSLSRHFLETAVKIVRDIIDLSLAPEKAHFLSKEGQIVAQDSSPGHTFEAILKNGTANNNENARRRYADHGLVYADYYFIEFGNHLLNMGLI